MLLRGGHSAVCTWFRLDEAEIPGRQPLFQAVLQLPPLTMRAVRLLALLTPQGLRGQTGSPIRALPFITCFRRRGRCNPRHR